MSPPTGHEQTLRVSDSERLRRWRLVLGGSPDDTSADVAGVVGVALDADDARLDATLAAVYDSTAGRRGGGSRRGGLASSAPTVARWLGDIRRYFPTSVVQVMQRDAIERLGVRQLLLEPELLREVEPDVHLVSMLVELNKVLPDATRASARVVVRRVVDDLRRRFEAHTTSAVHGALARSVRTRRPRPADIDWDRTIRANLRHFQPEHGTVVPERLVGHGRRQRSLARDVVIALDQSASMADSIVHASVFGAVLASMPALRTSIVAFDSSVTDLTAVAHDPVDLLFGVQLGGGTDIGSALTYCQRLVTRPSDTVLLLISDLFEGGNPDLLVQRVAELQQSGVCVVVLLALSDSGAPAHDHAMAATLAGMGAAAFACTPDRFPEVLSAAIERRPLPTGD